jgi:thiosulfate/3-mercaptopyruvate sulfurtransferase
MILMKTDERPFGHGKQKWVTTEWLENHLDDDMIILDTQPNVHDYFMDHIPDAVYLNQSTLRAPKNRIPAQILEPEQVASLLQRVGITKDKPVLTYTAKGGFKGWGDGLEQCMMAYTLLRMGHENVLMLDGGLDKWMDEGRETSQEFPELSSSNFEPNLQRSMWIELEEFKEVKDNNDTIVLDARPPRFYTGETGPWIRDGHIPGAINLPWANLMQDNKAHLKSVEEIRSMAEDAGATEDKLIICSCGTGREATNEYTIFKHLLNYPRVRLYEGSFTEWSAYPEHEVITGKQPR